MVNGTCTGRDGDGRVDKMMQFILRSIKVYLNSTYLKDSVCCGACACCLKVKEYDGSCEI